MTRFTNEINCKLKIDKQIKRFYEIEQQIEDLENEKSNLTTEFKLEALNWKRKNEI